VPNFVEETLRLESPVQFTKRLTSEDLEIVGEPVPAGTAVVTLLGAANRDPEMFPDPLQLDLERPNANRHVAFVVGAHHCLGSSLARLEGQIALQTLVQGLSGISRAGPPDRRPNLVARGWTHLPVRPVTR
jgi:cytochrome P450